MLMMDILNIIIIFQSDLYAVVNIPTYHGVAHIHSTITKLAEQESIMRGPESEDPHRCERKFVQCIRQKYILYLTEFW